MFFCFHQSLLKRVGLTQLQEILQALLSLQLHLKLTDLNFMGTHYEPFEATQLSIRKKICKKCDENNRTQWIMTTNMHSSVFMATSLICAPMITDNASTYVCLSSSHGLHICNKNQLTDKRQNGRPMNERLLQLKHEIVEISKNMAQQYN